MKKGMLMKTAVTLFIIVAASFAYCGAEQLIGEDRPDPDGTPTKVEVAVYLTDLSAVDSVQQSFSPTFIIMLRWKDPRLAISEAGDERLIRKKNMDEIWNPALLILNQKRLFKFLNPRDLVSIEPDGTVSYAVEFYGELVFPMNLKDFPFDRYVLPITLISGKYGPEDLEFAVDKTRTGRNKEFSIADWSIGPVEGSVGGYRLESQARDLARVDFKLPAVRYSGFYISRIIIPLIFIVLMSFSVFWIDPKELGTQLGVATTSILTLIAFQFAVNSSLPRIFYLTRLDSFILGATIIVFVAFLEAVVTSYLAKKGKVEAALSLDRKSRVIFPAVFVSLSLYSFFLS